MSSVILANDDNIMSNLDLYIIGDVICKTFKEDYFSPNTISDWKGSSEIICHIGGCPLLIRALLIDS